jgi:hypothetical protein
VLVKLLQVRAQFQQLKEPSWLVVDASQSVEQIHEQVNKCCSTVVAVSKCTSSSEGTDSSAESGSSAQSRCSDRPDAPL